MKYIEQYDTVISMNVDIQNDFCPGGSLAVTDGDAVVEPMNQLNRWVRDQNGLVVLSRDWHPPVTSHFDTWPRHCEQWKSGAAFHDDLEIVNGSETFGISGQDLIASKGMGADEDAYSAFEARIGWNEGGSDGGQRTGDLAEFLPKHLSGDLWYQNLETGRSSYPGLPRRQRVALCIGGLATDFCDKATVLGACELQKRLAKEYKIGVYILGNAMRAVNLQPGDGDKAMEAMIAAGGRVVTTDEIIAGEVFTVEG